MVYAEPVYVPPPPPPDRECLRWTWHGVDGSTWLLGRAAGAYLLRTAVAGLMLPAFSDAATASPRVAGQFYRSTRTLPRHLSFTVRTRAETSRDWLEIHRSWWRSWSPYEAGVLEVASVAGVRTLPMRLQSSGDQAFEADPSRWAMLTHELDAVADDPFWRGQPVERSWSTAPPVPFYGESGYGPPFYISQASVIDGATIDNPGDEDTWPVWTVEATAPTTDVRLTVAGGVIELPDLAAGEAIRVDTHPALGGSQRGSMVAGVFVSSEDDIDGLLSVYDARRLPAGERVPVGIAMTGAGSVSLSFTPRYWMAF